MNFAIDEYLYSMFEQPLVYAVLLLLSLVAYLYAGKKTSVGWLDPWMAQQLLTAAASATVIFLLWIGRISFGTALYHVMAAIIFFWIAASRSPRRLARMRARHPGRYWKASFAETGRLQLSVLIVLLASQAAMWSVTGLPVLLPSRLDAAATGGGVGAFTRIAGVFGTILVFLTVMRIGLRKPNYSFRRDAIVLTCVLLVQVGNGSKANIIYTVLFFIASDWLCRQVSLAYKPLTFKRSHLVASVCMVTGFALVPILLDNLVNNVGIAEGPLLQFVSRAILSGDSYIHFWGDSWITQFGHTSPTLLLGADLFGALRLVPREWLPVHPGIELYRELFPFSEALKGPNLRLDLFGLLYGGWLPGLVFVALAALVFRFMRSSIFAARAPTTIMASANLFLNAPAVFIDPTLGEGVLFNTAISLPILVVLWNLARAKRDRKPVRGEPPNASSDADPHGAPLALQAPGAS